MTAEVLPDIRDLIPHEPPMLLLDRIVSYIDDTVTCEVQIKAESAFLEENQGAEKQVPAVLGLEYMAQCVAAYAGITAQRQGRAPRIGFLIGCRELRLATEGFSVGDTLTVEARWVWGENELGSFACQVTRAGQKVVWGTLSVYRGPLPGRPPS
jgi:predicted hotdog family 3-hydroxylacyl-ACP dehydratase